MPSRLAQVRGYQHRPRPGYAPPARRTGRKFVKPAPKPKSRPAIKRQDLLDSRFGQRLSTLLHVVALASFSIIGGYAWDFFLMSGFRAGMLLGLITYGTFLSVSVALETKV